MPYGHIYLIRNRLNGKAYIGQTTQPEPVTRWYVHKATSRKARARDCPVLHKAIRKYGEAAFGFFLLSVADSQEELDELERQAIVDFRARVPYGYNLQNGGNGRGKHGPETCAKLSAAHRGRRKSLETRAKIRAAAARRAGTFEGHSLTRWIRCQARRPFPRFRDFRRPLDRLLVQERRRDGHRRAMETRRRLGRKRFRLFGLRPSGWRPKMGRWIDAGRRAARIVYSVTHDGAWAPQGKKVA